MRFSRHTSFAWMVALALCVSAPALRPTAAQAAGAKHRTHGRVLARRPAARPLRRARLSPRRPSVPWLKGSLPNVQAQGSLVADLADGTELFARRPDEPRPIASISKLAATLTAMDHGLDLDARTTITRVDAEVARGGAHSRLLEGMTLTNRDLLHAALLGSDNRAVAALGRTVGLAAPQFAAAMTAKVRSLGLKQTRFVEPTGLSPENVSTPREVIEMLRAVMDNPVLGAVTRTVEYDAHPIGRATIHYNNTYRPAARANTAILAGKTGFNNAARYCLVLVANVGGRTLGMSFLGAEGEMTRFADAGRVSDWVVAYRPIAAPSARAVAARDLSPLEGTAGPQSVAAITPPLAAPSGSVIPPALAPAPLLPPLPDDHDRAAPAFGPLSADPDLD